MNMQTYNSKGRKEGLGVFSWPQRCLPFGTPQATSVGLQLEVFRYIIKLPWEKLQLAKLKGP